MSAGSTSTAVTADDLELFAETLANFSGHVGRELFGSAGASHAGTADGDLGRADALMQEAALAGLLAEPRCAAGDDLGVWGRSVHSLGCRLTLTTLVELAKACAGFASLVHARGIGALAATGPEDIDATVVPDRPAAAFVPAYGLVLDPRNLTDMPRLSVKGATSELNGVWSFVWSTPDVDAWVVFAQDDDGWSVVAVPADAPGAVRQPVGARVGLRMLEQCELRVEGTAVGATPGGGAVLATGEKARRRLETVVACDWLGHGAMALGAAEGALRDATTYASDRVQGGKPIEDHPAVRLLLARARVDIDMARAVLFEHADVPIGLLHSDDLVGWGARTRLAIEDHSRRAVTASMQVLGGYGYMDDHGISKRLRDVAALASRHGSREQVLLHLAGRSRAAPHLAGTAGGTS